MSESLEGVKPGDLVVYDYPNTPDRLVSVERVSQHSVWLWSDSKTTYNIKNGSQRGDRGPWSYGSIRKATPEDVKRIKREAVVRSATTFVCNYVDSLRRAGGEDKKFLKLQKFIKEEL